MANPFDQFDEAPAAAAPSGGGNPFDQFDDAGAVAVDPVEAAAVKKQQMQSDAVSRLFSRDTMGSKLKPAQDDRKRDEDMLAQLRKTAPVNQQFARDLPEIGEAPELRQMSTASAKSGFASSLMTNEAELAKALQSLNPGAKVEQDPEGKLLITFPSGGSYALNRPGLSGQDFNQFATRLLAYAPTGKIMGVAKKQLMKGIAGAAGTEAGLQAAEAGIGGDFNKADVAISGAIAPVAQALPAAIGTISRLKAGSAKNELVEAGERAGVKVLTSDVFPPQTFAAKSMQQVGEKLPILGTGGVRADQQTMREKAVDEIASKYGEYSYDAIIESLKNQRDKVKSAAGSVLQKTGEKLDQLGPSIPYVRTNDAITAAFRDLKKPGVIRSEMALADLDKLITSLRESPQTFSTLKENRTAFREIVNSTDKADRSQLTSAAKAALSRIEQAMGADMRSFARQNLSKQEYDKWIKANEKYAEEAKNLTKSKLKTLLDKGEVSPEVAKNMLFSQNPSELKLLYQNLGFEGKKNARSAIISRIVNDLNKRISGITPNSFASELKKYEPHIKTFFKGDDLKQLQGLRLLLDSTRRAQDAAATTVTGQQMIAPGAVTGAAVGMVTSPTKTLQAIGGIGTLGGLTRLYESQRVRDALLKLGSVPRGSTEWENLLRQAHAAIAATAQSTTQSAQTE